MTDFLQLLHALQDGEVEFVLIGGVAAAAHGCSLVTQDVDVCVDPSQENWHRLARALAPFQPVHRMDRRRIPFPGAAAVLRNAYLATSAGQIDCLSEVTGVGGYAVVRANSIEVELGGRPLRLLSLAALIRAKEALGAPKDAEAVRQLRAIQGGKLIDPQVG
jgi:hypothetical protein